LSLSKILWPTYPHIATLFSDENPYKTYQSINNLEGVGGVDKIEEDKELAAAPTTLLEGTTLPIFEGLKLGYKPNLGSVHLS
jgi:hypothetical protein